MNWLDLICLALLLWGVYRGITNGFIVQFVALAALVAGIWLSFKLGRGFGSTFGIHDPWAGPVGFVILFSLIVVGMAVVGRFTRGIFKIAGLGAADTILGVFFSVLKVWLILSISLYWLASLPLTQKVFTPQTTENSALYKPLTSTAHAVFPYIDFAKQHFTFGQSEQPAEQTESTPEVQPRHKHKRK